MSFRNTHFYLHIFSKLIFYLSIFIIFIISWYSFVTFFKIPSYIFPTPKEVLFSFLENKIVLYTNLLVTLEEIISALLAGFFLGILTALFINYSKLLKNTILPILLITQAIPIFAIAPLIVIWFGYGIDSKIFIATLMIYFPITSSFYDGLRSTPSAYQDLTYVMRGKYWRYLWYIQIPAALPSLASGLRIAATFAPMGAIIGEWAGASQGLGYLVLNADARMEISFMFAVLACIIFLTIILYRTLDFFLRLYIYW